MCLQIFCWCKVCHQFKKVENHGCTRISNKTERTECDDLPTLLSVFFCEPGKWATKWMKLLARPSSPPRCFIWIPLREWFHPLKPFLTIVWINLRNVVVVVALNCLTVYIIAFSQICFNLWLVYLFLRLYTWFPFWSQCYKFNPWGMYLLLITFWISESTIFNLELSAYQMTHDSHLNQDFISIVGTHAYLGYPGSPGDVRLVMFY